MKSQGNTIVTTGIVLSRTSFHEADRIVTILTPDHGKVRVIAKGVRRAKSKLAGGIELFSVSDLTLLPGKSELQTLISSRLITYYSDIVKDIQRTMLGYEFLKRLNKSIENDAGGEYFELLRQALAGLNVLDLPIETVETWFNLQLLQLTGHTPNLRTDNTGEPLQPDQSYVFSFDDMTFSPHPTGEPSRDLIKYLRLACVSASPMVLGQVQAADELRTTALQMTKSMLGYTLRI